MNYINPILLSIENSSSLCSISLCNGIKNYYIEINNNKISSKYLLKIISYLLTNIGLCKKNINILAFGSGPGSFTSLRLVSSIVQGLSLGWKIPIIKILSLNAIALEASFIYKEEYILVVSNINKNNTCFYLYFKTKDKINKYLTNNLSKVKDINDIKLSKASVAGIINADLNYIKTLIKNNSHLKIKKNMYPKAIYIDFLARKLLINSKIDTPNKIHILYPDLNIDKKYNFNTNIIT